MQALSVELAVNVSGTTATAGQLFPGGAAVMSTFATTYDATCFLQVQGKNAAWANVNAAAYAANGLSAVMYLPAGTYRMNLGSTTAALYATLNKIPV